MKKRFSNLKLATKIVLMVAVLGVMAALTTLYALSNMRSVDREYRALINHEAQSALLIGDALLRMSDSSRLLYSVLTEQEVSKMHTSQKIIDDLQAQFNDKIQRIRPLMPKKQAELERILDHSKESFALAASVIDWAARWRGDHALAIIHQQFEPSMHTLQSEMNALRNNSIDNFKTTSVTLNKTTNSTIMTTALAVGIVLVLVLVLSGYVTIIQISRPIVRLTRIMGRLTLNNYDDEITGTSRRDEVGSMAKALQVFKDTMQRADQLEREAAASAKARDIAEQAAQAKAAFLATMSHEIRTPLNGMLGLTQIALKDDLTPRLRDCLEKILQAGRHLLEIINDILDFSKIDSGKLTIEAIEFDLPRLVDEVTEMMRPKAADKDLALRVAIDTTVPAMAIGDPTRIRQILLNYLNNAIKFTASGEVRLRMDAQPDGADGILLRCEVQDTGIGLSTEQMERLFQAFQQADESITRRFGGTGLGLAISKHLAELMEGQVGMHSVQGRGSTFWFTVRLARSRLADSPDGHHHVPAPADRPLPEVSTLKNLRILLVDDNDLNRQIGVELLKSEGVAVDVAENGQAAIDILQTAPDGTYAAVLMDMMMPVMDGLSATRALRANPRFLALPIIAMTANASARDVAAGKDAGTVAHIAKPIDEKVLWETLLRCVQVPRPDGPDATTLPAAEQQAPARLPSTGRRRGDAALMSTPGAYLPADSAQISLEGLVLGRMQQTMSAEHFENLLTVLIEDSRVRSLHIASSAQKGEFTVLDQMAHDLIGVAGNAGLSQLAALGAQLKQAVKRADLLQSQQLAAQIRQATLQSIQLLQERFLPQSAEWDDKHE
ncbi:ATP-binding protein [Paralcaligenes ginsengisoli]